MARNYLLRRDFLTVVLGALATTPFLYNPALADANEQFPDDKISVLVGLAKKVVAAQEAAVAEGVIISGALYSSEPPSITDTMVATIGFMDANFGYTNLDICDVRELFNPTPDVQGIVDRYGALSDEMLEAFVEDAVPVVVMRALLHYHDVRWDASRTSGWVMAASSSVFTSRYVEVVCAA